MKWVVVFILITNVVYAADEARPAASAAATAQPAAVQKVVPRLAPPTGVSGAQPNSRQAEVGWNHSYKLTFTGKMVCPAPGCEGGIIYLTLRQGRREFTDYTSITAAGAYTFDEYLRAPETGLVDWSMTLRTLSGNEWQQQGQMILTRNLDLRIQRDWVLQAAPANAP